MFLEDGQFPAGPELTLGALEYHVKYRQVHQEEKDRKGAVVALKRLGHDNERGEIGEETLVLGS